MTYPRDLWEDTALENTAYPFQLFQNRCLAARAGHCILYLHWHEHFELLVMKRGSAVFHIDSRPYAAAEGDVLIIPGGSLHVGYSSPKATSIMTALSSMLPCLMTGCMILYIFNTSPPIWKAGFGSR